MRILKSISNVICNTCDVLDVLAETGNIYCQELKKDALAEVEVNDHRRNLYVKQELAKLELPA